MVMGNNTTETLKNKLISSHVGFFVFAFFCFTILFFIFPELFSSATSYSSKEGVLGENNLNSSKIESKKIDISILPPLDKAAYDKKILALANNPAPKAPVTKTVKDPKTGKLSTVTIEPKPLPPSPWPVKAAYPKPGAILPFSRVIAYYGNLYSTKMGVLGQYPETEMLGKLEAEVKKWQTADPTTPVVPALHYIAVVAQGSAGRDGKYRARMPDSEIEKVLKMADKINAIVFLDMQVGFSDVESEVPYFEKYLKLPNVHLGIDPEFSMKGDIRPGKVIGTFNASDVNFAANYLAKLVKENNLPPKILIVHRFTQGMLTGYQSIKPLPEVQIVINMDGWGPTAKKIGTYNNFIYPQPVQFTGFKLFYKNDTLTPGSSLMTPPELLKLSPQPIYIQYQ